jgi:hypothetical protein
MNRIKNLQRWIIFAVLCALLFSPTLPGRAQQSQQMQTPQTITGTGTFSDFNYPGLSITFPPIGAAVTGSLFFQGDLDPNAIVHGCPGTITVDMSGSFDGGDEGIARGDIYLTTKYDTTACGEESTIFGTWNGRFNANGTGSGVFTITGLFGIWKCL